MKINGPDFLIIGAMKAGTTSLHDYLGRHPEIYTTNPKEIHYFTDEYYHKKPLEWYQSHFKTEKKLRGASPQNYTKRHDERFKNVPERIFKHFPDTKLIYVVRNPLQRILSHYREAQEGGYEPEVSLSEFLSDYRTNHYVLTSCYYYQIEAYLPYFRKENICLITSEDLRNNRLETLNEVFRFLDVAPLKDELMFNFESNTIQHKTRANWLSNVIYSKNTLNLRSIIPEVFKEKLRNNLQFKKMIRTQSFKSEYIEPHLLEEIKLFLKEDVEKLSQWSGKSFNHWNL